MSTYAGASLTSRGLTTAAVAAFDVRQDGRGNACMAHIGDNGMVCGWELKNRAFTGFAPGGTNGLALGRLDCIGTRRVVVVESFIDAISFAQLFHQEGDLYVSTAGTVSSKQVRQLAALASANPQACCVAATDADQGGDAIALTLAEIAPGRVVRHRPSAKDWSDVLQFAEPKLGRVV